MTALATFSQFSFPVPVGWWRQAAVPSAATAVAPVILPVSATAAAAERRSRRQLLPAECRY